MKDNAKLKGSRFNRWVILSPAKNNRGKSLCECDCGNIREVSHSNLVYGLSKSCGCLQKEKASSAKKTHGLADTPVYKVWQAMHTRCYNKNFIHYPYYGGRGITVCEKWHSFESFISDMGIPEKGLTLDRIDNNLNYTKENCRWVTRKEQTRNRRATKTVEFNGEAVSIAKLADDHNISYSLLNDRLNKGWPIEKAIQHVNFVTKKPL